MIIVPLGVASATPTVSRHLSSVALWREGSVFLFDCGENTQMRMLQGGLKRSQIDCIFISHFDTDHYSGLLGLLATLQLQRREDSITLVGPEGLQEYVQWNLDFANVGHQYEINYVELPEDFEHERVVDTEEYYIEARPLNHTRFCIGYRFQEKDSPGKVDAEKAQAQGISEDWQYKELKDGNDVELDDGSTVKAMDIVGHPRPGDSFAYVTDTRYCPNAVKLAQNTNVLIHEATFNDSLADKAEETGHSTAKIAARVANEAKTKLLVITHFSARYTNEYVLLREARDHFFPAWVATELRPIFTDPAHEKGIIERRAYVKEIDNDGGKGSSSSRTRRKKHSNSDNDGRKKRRSRSKRERVKRSGHSSTSQSRSRKRIKKDDNSSGEASQGDRNSNSNDSENDERQPRPSTPRTTFDDFDRF